MKTKLMYVWLDNNKKFRNKIRVVDELSEDFLGRYSIQDIPEWGFDGSSTGQANGNFSDLILRPVYMSACVLTDVNTVATMILVLCEVLNADGSPHVSNTRAQATVISEKYKDQEALFGIEQEYVIMKENGIPIGWPAFGYPEPQGDFYCNELKNDGGLISYDHLQLCLNYGLSIVGTNAEVMPGQWEFQTGPLSLLEASDQLLMTRFLLESTARTNKVYINYEPKPIKTGDWNGSGAHTNFSTKAMREPDGIIHIVEACEKLKNKHAEHIAVYGEGNELRLTGKHETCSINEFRYGVGDRGASIRIPLHVNKAGCGYLEDRRPAANMDPYLVCAKILETVCGN